MSAEETAYREINSALDDLVDKRARMAEGSVGSKRTDKFKTELEKKEALAEIEFKIANLKQTIKAGAINQLANVEWNDLEQKAREPYCVKAPGGKLLGDFPTAVEAAVYLLSMLVICNRRHPVLLPNPLRTATTPAGEVVHLHLSTLSSTGYRGVSLLDRSAI